VDLQVTGRAEGETFAVFIQQGNIDEYTIDQFLAHSFEIEGEMVSWFQIGKYGFKEVTLDLANVIFINSTGIDGLVRLLKVIGEQNMSLRIVNDTVPREIRRLFIIIGLSGVFDLD
jgi:anti-anti-sigma factor